MLIHKTALQRLLLKQFFIWNIFLKENAAIAFQILFTVFSRTTKTFIAFLISTQT